MAGDATGIIVAAAITSLLGLPMGIEAVIGYGAGFAFGLFIFQALFMKEMLGGNYWQAVKGTWLAEWLSMNAVMGSKRTLPRRTARRATQFDREGYAPQTSMAVGTHRVPVVALSSKLAVALLTALMLAGVVALAARFGDLSMRADDRAPGTMKMRM